MKKDPRLVMLEEHLPKHVGHALRNHIAGKRAKAKLPVQEPAKTDENEQEDPESAEARMETQYNEETPGGGEEEDRPLPMLPNPTRKGAAKGAAKGRRK